nr:MAG TPA: hypothetical protein [Caudoviricetes sp.]
MCRLTGRHVKNFSGRKPYSRLNVPVFDFGKKKMKEEENERRIYQIDARRF